MKFIASRLSEGNKLFPPEIQLEPAGITVKIPGLFSGESKYFDFVNIASVEINTPAIGYSTITIYAGGTKISTHGFTKSEVEQIKQGIENGKNSSKKPLTKKVKVDSSDDDEAVPIGNSLNSIINLSFTNDLEETKQKLDTISVQLMGYKWDISSSKIAQQNNQTLNQCLQQYKIGVVRLKQLTTDLETIKHYEKELLKLKRKKILNKYWAFILLFVVLLSLIVIVKLK